MHGPGSGLGNLNALPITVTSERSGIAWGTITFHHHLRAA